MKLEMYKIFYEIQKTHWWFVVKKIIILEQIKKYFNKSENSKILDIGCGSGLMLNSLNQFGKTYGMDNSVEAVKFSKEIYNGEVRIGNLPTDLPYSVKIFDLIIALDVIEHIECDIESLEAINSLLKSDGMAIITVPAYMFLWSSFDDINEHKRRYTLNELKNKLIKANFKIVKISYYNTILFPIIYVIRKMSVILKKDPWSDLKKPNKIINYVLTKIFEIEKYLLREINFPFGVSIIAIVKK